MTETELRKRITFKLRAHNMPPSIHISSNTGNIDHCTDQIMHLFATYTQQLLDSLVEEGPRDKEAEPKVMWPRRHFFQQGVNATNHEWRALIQAKQQEEK